MCDQHVPIGQSGRSHDTQHAVGHSETYTFRSDSVLSVSRLFDVQKSHLDNKVPAGWTSKALYSMLLGFGP